MKITGIYKITNTSNNKIYIGSSEDCNHRWNRHKSALNRNKHKNIHLQTAWNKYGADKFKLSIIEQCNKDNLLKKEQYYLDNTNCLNEDFGYNMQPKAYKVTKISNYGKLKMSLGGKMQKGRKHTKESKKHMSEAQKGKRNNGSIKQMKQVFQFDINGKFIKQYNCVSDASKETGVCDRSISNAACPSGKAKLAGGYIWSYNENILIPKRIWKKQKTYQYDLNGNLLNIYDTAKEAGKATNICSANIRYAASHRLKNGELKTAGGFCWKYGE